jgi:hypothetical protein
MAAPELYESATPSMDAPLIVRLIFGVLVATGLYLGYVVCPTLCARLLLFSKSHVRSRANLRPTIAVHVGD